MRDIGAAHAAAPARTAAPETSAPKAEPIAASPGPAAHSKAAKLIAAARKTEPLPVPLIAAAHDLSASLDTVQPTTSPQLVRASWYGGGERLSAHTADGEVFRPMALTAAHRTLPFGTMLRVTSPTTGLSTIVRVNDRGPAASTGYAIDLSRGAATALGIVDKGGQKVTIEVMR